MTADNPAPSYEPQHDPDDMKAAFNAGGSMLQRLDNVAEVGARVGEEDAKERVLSKIDDLIWRRKLHDKPYDQLEEIRDEVENL